jgi:hypothetical protein
MKTRFALAFRRRRNLSMLLVMATVALVSMAEYCSDSPTSPRVTCNLGGGFVNGNAFDEATCDGIANQAGRSCSSADVNSNGQCIASECAHCN